MKHNTSIPSSHWIFVYHVKKKNHLQNEAKVPLSIHPRALVPNASNLHSNIVWKTHFSKLLSLEFTFVNSNYTKKKKRKKKSTWKIENGGEAGTNWMLHFYTDDVAFKSFSKEGAIYDWCTCVKLCSWLEVYAERPLSLSYTANCSQPCTKEWPPLFLTTSRIPFSSMLFTLHEFTRFLTSPLFRWEINPSIVGIVLSTVREQKLWTD